MLGGNLSVLDKAEAVLLKDKQPSARANARRKNKELIMQDIIKGGKPSIAKKK